MIVAVIQGDGRVEEGIAVGHPALCGFPHTFFDRGDIFSGNGAAFNGVGKDQALIVIGLNLEEDMTELTPPARLADIAAFSLRSSGNGFAIGDLRGTRVDLDLKLTHESVQNHFEVQFPHAGQNGLAGLGVGLNNQGRVLGGEALEGEPQLFGIDLGFGLNRDRDHRLLEGNRFEQDRLMLDRDGVAGRKVLETHDGDDVSGRGTLQVFFLIGVHANQTTNALAAFGARVKNRSPGLYVAAVQTDKGQLSGVGVVHGFEGQAGQEIIRDLPGTFFSGEGLARHGSYRRRKIVDHGIQERLDTLVAQGGSAQDRKDVERLRLEAHRGGDFFRREGFAAQIFLQQSVIGIGHAFNQQLGEFRCLRLELWRNFLFVKPRPKRILLPDQGLMLNQIDHTRHGIFCADRQLENQRPRPQPVLDLIDHPMKVRTDTIQFVDKNNTRHAVFVRLPPHGLRLWFDPANPTEDDNGAVQHAQAALHLGGKIHMAGRINDIDLMVVPVAGNGRRRNRDAPLTFLRHPVGDRRPFVHLTDFVRETCIVQDAFAHGGLAAINVGDDADVSSFFQRGRHVLLPTRCTAPRSLRNSTQKCNVRLEGRAGV